MATRIDGDNLVVPGQAAVSGAPTSLEHVVTMRYGGSMRAFVRSLDMNAAAPIDLSSLPVQSSLFVPVRALVYNPTANVSAATLGLYSAAGGGGTEIIAPTLLANLTAAGKIQELTIAALTDALTASTLYPRLTVAAGGAGSASLMLEFIDLSLI